jgi:glycosyltransferase involved in cell wall biosynthesis
VLPATATRLTPHYHAPVQGAGDHHARAPTSRVRVLLVTKSLGHGGAEKLLIDLVATGDHRAFDYEVAYILDSEDTLVPALESQGITVHRLGAVHNFDVRWMVAFRRLLKRKQYDVVHFHLPYSAALGRPVVLSIRGHRPVTLYTEHSLWNKVSPLVKLLNGLTIRCDGGVVAVSQAAYDALPVAVRRRASVVVHGVDLSSSVELVARRSEVRKDVRTELNLPDGELLAVTVANLRSEKGYDVLLECAHLVAERGLPITFVAAGAGSLAHELALTHQALGLGDRFRFLGRRADALALMTAADIVVLPSRQEGLPVVLMEATSVGAAVVATSVGGVPQVIIDGRNGLLVSPGRPEALADAIERLWTQPELRATLGRQAGADSARFDIARASAELEELYRALLMV